MLHIQGPGKPTGAWGSGGGTIPIKAVSPALRLWRKIVVDVTPQTVLVRWQTETGELEPFIQPAPRPRHWTNDEVRTIYGRLQKPLNEQMKAPTPMPDWSSSLALGIKASQSTIAFRNVTIEPLPDETPTP